MISTPGGFDSRCSPEWVESWPMKSTRFWPWSEHTITNASGPAAANLAQKPVHQFVVARDRVTPLARVVRDLHGKTGCMYFQKKCSDMSGPSKSTR